MPIWACHAGDYLKTKRALLRAVEKQAQMAERLDNLKTAVGDKDLAGASSLLASPAKPGPQASCPPSASMMGSEGGTRPVFSLPRVCSNLQTLDSELQAAGDAGWHATEAGFPKTSRGAG